MTRTIDRAASRFAGEACRIVCKSTPGAPKFIAGYADDARAAPGMLHLLREYHDGFDGFVLACHGDPNLDAARQIADKPVVGIGEASMTIASMLGHKFSILSPDERIIPSKEEQVRTYHLEARLASIRIPDHRAGRTLEEGLLEAAGLAVEHDMAEVIVLGCAAYAGLERILSEKLQVPVVDGVMCALMIVEGLVKCGLSHSKRRKYGG